MPSRLSGLADFNLAINDQRVFLKSRGLDYWLGLEVEVTANK
ncbi:hypothetical protein OAV21_01815 [bacterium]|nr:hypothetical protein [bacterium]